MRLAALFSGGKDSSFAIYTALNDGHIVTDLVTVIPANEDSYMYHSTNIHLTELISEACGIPLTTRYSAGEKETELKDLKDALMDLKIDGVAVGAIESEYQASRVKRICGELGLKMYAPLWKKEPEDLLNGMITCMDIRIVKIAAGGMDEKWLGRRFDRQLIEDLKVLKKKYGVHIAGEGGEYETLVLDAPFYNKRINILRAKNIWKGDHGIMKIIHAELAEKI